MDMAKETQRSWFLACLDCKQAHFVVTHINPVTPAILQPYNPGEQEPESLMKMVADILKASKPPGASSASTRRWS